jgi:hypothetical protein
MSAAGLTKPEVFDYQHMEPQVTIHQDSSPPNRKDKGKRGAWNYLNIEAIHIDMCDHFSATLVSIAVILRCFGCLTSQHFQILQKKRF